MVMTFFWSDSSPTLPIDAQGLLPGSLFLSSPPDEPRAYPFQKPPAGAALFFIQNLAGAPDYDRSQWLNDKFKLGLDFPNLPYLIDGSHKITQSNAILRYLARKHNLCGETEEERVRMDILENQAMDSRIQMGMLCYSPDFEKQKPEFLKGLPDHLKLYSEFLGKQPWFAGDKITYVDFLVYDVLDQHRIFEPKCLDAFPNLKDFLARFEGLKKISAYMKSSRFLPRPVYLKLATWGNKQDPALLVPVPTRQSQALL
ncbi:glutathione S-transferase Mu 6-like isoform X2 [Peromyscus maniculatus bairdii]|uniref:glutathione S-transferase Mu 6-like isoform X2 n=1 Tax=Peromyscus maniculatus bairdii TaxID=230844 RepID=UPI003FD3897B